MPSDETLVTLTLSLEAVEGVDPNTTHQWAQQLLREIRTLEVTSASFARDETAPPGTKVVEPISLGTILTIVAPILIPQVFRLVEHWMQRHERQPLIIEAERNGQKVKIVIPASVKPEQVSQYVQTVMRGLALEVEGR